VKGGLPCRALARTLRRGRFVLAAYTRLRASAFEIAAHG